MSDCPDNYEARVWLAKDSVTLRDAFAIAALQRMAYPCSPIEAQTLAVNAFVIADAMLKERTK